MKKRLIILVITIVCISILGLIFAYNISHSSKSIGKVNENVQNSIEENEILFTVSSSASYDEDPRIPENLLDMVDRCVSERKNHHGKMQFLLVTTIIYKDYLKEYSNESILTLSATSFFATRYEDIELYLGDFVPRYNDEFLKEIYNRRKKSDSIMADLVTMNKIYDKFLDNSKISREEKNNALLKTYMAMSNDKISDLESKINKNLCEHVKLRKWGDN